MNEQLVALFEAAAQTSQRSEAAAAVLEWAASGDISAESFDDMAIALAGIEDATGALSDEQIDLYNEWLIALAEAAISLGAKQLDVTNMIDEFDSDAALAVSDAVRQLDEDEAIATYGVAGAGGDDESGALMESAMLEASIKVVRGGVVKVVRKRPRKMRISGAQRAALKRARLKAHTAVAKIARSKSMKIRKKHGL